MNEHPPRSRPRLCTRPRGVGCELPTFGLAHHAKGEHDDPPRKNLFTGVSIDAKLSPEAIREACRRAAEAGTRFLDKRIVEEEVVDSTISYAITGPGGFVQVMDFMVGWEGIGDGRRRVSLAIGDFMTNRMTLWGFIPIEPRSVTAMGSLQRFSARLRKELS